MTKNKIKNAVDGNLLAKKISATYDFVSSIEESGGGQIAILSGLLEVLKADMLGDMLKVFVNERLKEGNDNNHA